MSQRTKHVMIKFSAKRKSFDWDSTMKAFFEGYSLDQIKMTEIGEHDRKIDNDEC